MERVVAELLWGQVYLRELYAGILREEPGGRCSFTYDRSFLDGGHPAIAWTLPLQEAAHVSQEGLHPFFDNLVSEGWLEAAQTRLLGKRTASRFELLLAFGQDCAGAVAVADASPAVIDAGKMNPGDSKEMAVLKGRASLSGIQPKFALVEERGKYRPAGMRETSTHIAKFPSGEHQDLVANEYLTMRAFAALVGEDPVAEVAMGQVEGTTEKALIVRRFDRAADRSRVHFEEFNQLLGRKSTAKYDGAYREMADFLRATPGCLPAEVYRLYVRILAGLLLGNTDMHFKNFAMLHTTDGFRLAPSYDQVASAQYGYNSIALELGGAADIPWTELKARSLVRLGEEFRLSPAAMRMAYEQLAARRERALAAIASQVQVEEAVRESLLNMVKKRWNGTFSLIGGVLSKKR